MARATFIKIIGGMATERRRNGENGKMSLRMIESMLARIRFEAGPASEISAESRLGFWRLKGSNCTGRPHPNRIKRSISVPSGSRWASGFRVRRPCRRGVGSPSWVAVNAWANS